MIINVGYRIDPVTGKIDPEITIPQRWKSLKKELRRRLAQANPIQVMAVERAWVFLAGA